MTKFADKYYPYLRGISSADQAGQAGHAGRAGQGGFTPGRPDRIKQPWRQRRREAREEDTFRRQQLQDAFEQDILMLRFDPLVARSHSRGLHNHDAGLTFTTVFPPIVTAPFLDVRGSADNADRIAEESDVFFRNTSPSHKKKKHRHGHGPPHRLQCNTTSKDSRFRVKKSPKYATSRVTNVISSSTNSANMPSQHNASLVNVDQMPLLPMLHSVMQAPTPSAPSVPNRPRKYSFVNFEVAAAVAFAPAGVEQGLDSNLMRWVRKRGKTISPLEEHIDNMWAAEVFIMKSESKKNKRKRGSR